MLKQIHKLCKPAYVYLVISAITIILMMVQNAGASGTYKVGMYQCPCNNTAGIFLGKAIYVAFWTFILNAVCKAGYKSVSWFLVLFPMILGAVLVGLVLMSGGIREGLESAPATVLPEAPKSFYDSFIQRIFNFLSSGRFETNRQRFNRENEERTKNADSNNDNQASVRKSSNDQDLDFGNPMSRFSAIYRYNSSDSNFMFDSDSNRETVNLNNEGTFLRHENKYTRIIHTDAHSPTEHTDAHISTESHFTDGHD